MFSSSRFWRTMFVLVLSVWISNKLATAQCPSVPTSIGNTPPPTTNAQYHSNPTPTLTKPSPGTAVLHMSLDGLAFYGGVDILYGYATGTSNAATWTFTLPPSIQPSQVTSACFVASMVAADNSNPPNANQMLGVWTNGAFIFDSTPGLPSGVPIGGPFTDWTAVTFGSSVSSSGTYTITMANLGPAVPGSWFAIKWIELHLTLGCQVDASNITLTAFGSEMLASFTPPSGTLSAYATACGFAGLDWQQTITSLPCPNVFEPNKPSALPLKDFCKGGGITAVIPFSDPPDGGYTYFFTSGSACGPGYDPYPFYYASALAISQEQFPTPGAPCTCARRAQVGDENVCVTPLVTGDDMTLAFQDAPADSSLPAGSIIAFTTSLVGINLDGSASPPLATWSWATSFNGTVAGMPRLSLPDDPPPDPGSGTGGVIITSINGIPQTPPAVTCFASPNTLWPPNGKLVVVTVSGTLTAGTKAIIGSAYAVKDEYGQVQPSGTIALGAGGSYSFGVSLIAARNGDDGDGRKYTIVVGAKDTIGNVGSCSAVVTVTHDQGN